MKSILFNAEMVMGILEGRQTTTRRIVKPQPKQPIPLGFVVSSTDSKNEGCFGWGKDKYGGTIDYEKPPYKIGDVLYVRETFNDEETDSVLYAADEEFVNYGCKEVDGYLFMESDIKWKPPIYIPKKLARIFLKVTDVRVERLQDIEAKALGKYDPWAWTIEFKKLVNYKI